MPSRTRTWVYAISAVLLAALVAFGARAFRGSGPAVPGRGKARIGQTEAGAGIRVGAPQTFDSLALFAVFSDGQQDVGSMTSLPAALAEGSALVREMGAGAGEGAVNEREQQNGQLRRHRGSGPTVNTLVIENKGNTPIYVLAGTVVKGGNQDRQIGQDFVVAAKSTVPVDAFCVEHGRWNGQREGASTGGKFVAVDQLATSKVRVAGQYARNQSEVWAKVAEVNAENKKSAASGTLLATLDDETMRARRGALAQRMTLHLTEIAETERPVGIAWAVDGRVRGVRWFASASLFELFRETLVNTAAADAVSSETGSKATRPPPVTSKDVLSFIQQIDAEQAEERSTPADNVNEYKKAKAGYGSSTRLKGVSPSAKPAAPLSKDYAAK